MCEDILDIVQSIKVFLQGMLYGISWKLERQVYLIAEEKFHIVGDVLTWYWALLCRIFG